MKYRLVEGINFINQSEHDLALLVVMKWSNNAGVRRDGVMQLVVALGQVIWEASSDHVNLFDRMAASLSVYKFGSFWLCHRSGY